MPCKSKTERGRITHWSSSQISGSGLSVFLFLSYLAEEDPAKVPPSPERHLEAASRGLRASTSPKNQGDRDSQRGLRGGDEESSEKRTQCSWEEYVISVTIKQVCKSRFLGQRPMQILLSISEKHYATVYYANGIYIIFQILYTCVHISIRRKINHSQTNCCLWVSL